MTILNAEKLVKIYKGKGSGSSSTNALNGISLSVGTGEFVAIMGPSGSGKTTLLNVLGGIDTVTSGEIDISGRSIRRMSQDELALFRRQSLGFVFQEFHLLDSLTLKENIMLPMILDGRDAGEMEQVANEVTALFGIEDIADKYPYAVSGGQQQRAAISRAIVNEPELVFADEPTGNLDSKSSRMVMECFEKLNSLKNSTILMVTHDPFAASYCSKVIFIRDGMIYREIVKQKDRKQFLDQILNCLAEDGGEEACDI